MSKKNSKGVPLGFYNIHSAAKHQKNAGEKFPKKMSRSAEEKLKGGNFSPLVLPGMVCYAEKQGKPFWSSSLGQMVQFDTIIFGKTFKNYFGQFVWIGKKSHYNSRVSLHEAPTKNQARRFDSYRKYQQPI